MKILIFLLIVSFALPACAAPQSQLDLPTETPPANLPNPASVYCEQQGYRLEIRTAADGSQSGFCIFPDGGECDEWAYYRGECQPPAQAGPTETLIDTDDTDIASDGCKIYRNEALGYSFHYPADAQIIQNDEPLGSFTVEGALLDGEHWPQYTISHPAGREEYRPPEDADLEQWLVDHYLLAEERQPDIQIAGVTAIHLRHNRSPQSYANDRYFFAKSGQLYMIVIGHAGDKEDWDLYNHFLESFQFEETEK